MENTKLEVPRGESLEDIKAREQIISDVYRKWYEANAVLQLDLILKTAYQVGKPVDPFFISQRFCAFLFHQLQNSFRDSIYRGNRKCVSLQGNNKVAAKPLLHGCLSIPRRVSRLYVGGLIGFLVYLLV